MKKQILDALKAKFVGVSEKVLDRVAEKLLKTVTGAEDIATAIEGVTFQQVLDGYGDARATEAQQTAVSNYEKKHNLKDGVKVEEGGGKEPKEEKEPKGTEEVPVWAKGLIDSNKKLSDELASIKGKEVVGTRKTKLADILKDAPDKLKTRYEKDFDRIQFKDDEDFDGWLADITPDITALSAEIIAKGGVVTRPKGGTKTDASKEASDLVKARVESRKAETVAPAIIGLPTNPTK